MGKIGATSKAADIVDANKGKRLKMIDVKLFFNSKKELI